MTPKNSLRYSVVPSFGFEFTSIMTYAFGRSITATGCHEEKKMSTPYGNLTWFPKMLVWKKTCSFHGDFLGIRFHDRFEPPTL